MSAVCFHLSTLLTSEPFVYFSPTLTIAPHIFRLHLIFHPFTLGTVCMYKRLKFALQFTVKFPSFNSNPLRSRDSELPFGSVYDRDIRTETFILFFFKTDPLCSRPAYPFPRCAHLVSCTLALPLLPLASHISSLASLPSHAWWLIVLPYSYLLPYRPTLYAPRNLHTHFRAHST